MTTTTQPEQGVSAADKLAEALCNLLDADDYASKVQAHAALAAHEAERAEPAPAPVAVEPKCSTHPDAPHGFDRNRSHTAGRYVCDCEGWEPESSQAPAPRVGLELTDAQLTAGWDACCRIEDPDNTAGLMFAESVMQACATAWGITLAPAPGAETKNRPDVHPGD